MIYVSCDVYCLGCDLISYGTGTPVAKGFDIDEVIHIITKIVASNKMVTFEISEVNPLLDNRGNRMAEAAFEVLDAVTGKIKSQLRLEKSNLSDEKLSI
jgi:arginase